MNKKEVKEYLINYLDANQDEIEDTLMNGMDDLELADFDLLQFTNDMKNIIKEMRNKTKVIIEVSGGVVQGVFSDKPNDIELSVIDWDDINEGEEPPEYKISPLSKMDEETKDLLNLDEHNKIKNHIITERDKEINLNEQ